MGSGKGTGAASSALKLSKALQTESAPVRGELLGQVLEALRTGGAQAQIPIVQRATEANRGALSQAMGATGESIASMPGLAGSPYAAAILAQMRQQGEQAIANIGPEYAQQLAGMAPNLALGFPQLAQQGYLGAGGLQAQIKGQLGGAPSLLGILR